MISWWPIGLFCDVKSCAKLTVQTQSSILPITITVSTYLCNASSFRRILSLSLSPNFRPSVFSTTKTGEVKGSLG
jgi:hypothetical protein